MYRAVYLSGRWMAVKITDDLMDDEQEVENIQTFLDNGDVVVLGDSIETIQKRLEEEVQEVE